MEKAKLLHDGAGVLVALGLVAAFGANGAQGGVSVEQLGPVAITSEFNAVVPEELKYGLDDEFETVKPKPQPKRQ